MKLARSGTGGVNMSEMDEPKTNLDRILTWARLAGELSAALRPHEQGLHLRPSSTGIRVIDLNPTRPQLDRGKITSPVAAEQKLRQLMAERRSNVPGRETPEKHLQSWLIAEAYRNRRTMASLSDQLTFVTDEQVLSHGSGRIVCDILAMRRTGAKTAPVVIELKSARQLTRLVAQLTAAAAFVDAHLEQFSRVFGALVLQHVELSGPCEKWLVWSGAQHRVDPRTEELRRQGVSLRCFRKQGASYQLS